jgi:putative membrane protein
LEQERVDQVYDRVPVTDGLAGERTLLAAERTLLAYVRTAFGLFAAGVTGSQLLDDALLVAVGHAMALLAVVVLSVGFLRYRRSRRATLNLLRRLLRETEKPPG